MPNIVTASTPAVQVDYATGRSMIRSGDIVNFFSSHEESVVHRFTTEPILYFTGSRIYHTGVAIWIHVAGEDRLMLCEAVGVGRRLLNLSHFKDMKMEVHPRPEYVNQLVVEKHMLDDLGQGYGFWTLIIIGVREFFGAKPKAPSNRKVCSEIAAEAWQAGGMKFETTVLSPGKLRNVLTQAGIPPAFVINAHAG